MYFDYLRNGYIQIATVHGAIRGDKDNNVPESERERGREDVL